MTIAADAKANHRLGVPVWPPLRVRSNKYVRAIENTAVIWAPLAIILASGAALALLMAHYRADAIASGERLVESYAQLAEEQTTRTIQSVDQTLRAAETTLAATAPATEPLVSAALSKLLVDRRYIRALRVLDTDGRTVFSTAGDIGMDLSARPYFQRHREFPDDDFELSAPLRSVTTVGRGLWLLPATRPWRGANGEVTGLIVAGMDPAHFSRVWTFDALNKDLSIGLFRSNGVMLARSPFIEALMGKSLTGSAIFGTLLPASPAGTFRNTSVVDGRLRLVSYRQLGAYPELVIVVTTTVDQVLASWRQYALIIAIGWFVASVALVAFALSLRRTLDRRRENEARYRLLFDANPHPMWVFDRDTLRFLAVNRAAIEHYGWSREEFLNMTLNEIRRPEDRAELQLALLDQNLATPQALYRMRHRTRSGALIEVETTARLTDFDGRRAGVVLAQDVTERTKAEQARHSMEERLHQAQKMEAVGQMTGGIAHDFNNILAIIMMKMEVLEDELPADSPYLGFVRGTTAAAARGADLVARLLTFSRSRELKAVETDIAALLAGFEPLLAAAVPQINLAIEVADDLSRCMVDRTGLETAILNLAVNARDAMPAHDTLHITARNKSVRDDDTQRRPETIVGEWVEIAVTDTGTGMSAEVQAKIFEPFFTTKAEGKGTGLGLSMVHGFIHQSGGFATIDSTLGHGTTIKLYLPAMAAQPAAGPQDSSSKVVPFLPASRQDGVVWPAQAA